MELKTTFPILIALASALSLEAGTFTNSFNSGLPAGTTLYGNAVVLANSGVDGGCLQITTNAASQSAGFIINDLDSGAKIGSFVANFQVAVGPSTPTPADGFSFSFGSDIANGTISEDGAGSGIRVEFDTYSNGGSDDIGIDIWWKGSIFATIPLPITTLAQYPAYVPVTIELTTSGTLNVTYNGAAIYSALQLTNFAPMQGRFAFGGRTGGSKEFCRIDNLGIDTGPADKPQFLTASPTGTGIRPNPLITVTIWDGYSTQVAPSTIVMTLNSNAVTRTVSKAGLITTVQYAAPALPSGSTNYVAVTFADTGAPATNLTNTFSFTLAAYPTLPANYAATVDTTKFGFTQRISQGGTTTVGSIAAAETLLAGLLINPATGQPFPNTATTNTDATWTFVQTNVLNYNITAPANAGDFTNDTQYPGMPGTNGSTINFALEALTYLNLTPGAYTFGVNSDDGFRLSSIATQVGVYDAGRGAADSIFSCVVTQAGYYPFRLVHFQGTSSASLEWFSVTPAGQKILINDTNTAGAIRAYSKATSSLPYFLGSYPAGTGNRPDKPIVVQMQDGAIIKVNTNTIRLTVNGTTVTPGITQAGPVTTVQYNSFWASGSSNFVVVSFADNEGVPFNQTNQYSFIALTYNSLPATYAINPASVDTSKPGFLQKVFQTDRVVPATIANAETMLAGQLADAAGNLSPNSAAANIDGSHTFAQATVLNYNVAAPAAAGNFSGDTQFPGIPGVNGSTNTFALEAITYLYLPVGYYSLGVNSDDGFRLTTSPNPHDEFPYQLSLYDGTRTAADTTAAFGITNAGYYPFRLVYFQGSGPASLELFSVAVSGQKTLVNDTTAPGYIHAYRSAANLQPYVQWAYPYRALSYLASPYNPIGFILVDGTPAIQTDTIQLTINGTVVSPLTYRMHGTNIVVSYVPSSFQQTTNTTLTVQLTYADALGHYTTDSFSFILYGSEALAPLWTLPPGSRPYITSGYSGSTSPLQCGLAYNPVTGHLLLSSMLNQTTVRGIYILDPLTGNELGQLKLTNASGSAILSSVQFPAYKMGVADDGVIYADNVKQTAPSSALFELFRWGSETDFPSVVFNDSGSSLPFRLGDDLSVRGAGPNTQIVCGGGSSADQGMLFKTANGTNFTATLISPIVGIFAGDLWSGIDFGSNNTFYCMGPGTRLRQVSFDPATGSASVAATYTINPLAGQFGPLGVDLINKRLIVVGTSSSAGVSNSVSLFRLDELALAPTANAPLDSSYISTSNANGNRAGSVAITPDGSMAFVLDVENGVTAYELSVPIVVRPTLSVTRSGSHVTLTWADATYGLQAAPVVNGTYTNVPGAVTGYNPPASGTLFFRLAK